MKFAFEKYGWGLAIAFSFLILAHLPEARAADFGGSADLEDDLGGVSNQDMPPVKAESDANTQSEINAEIQDATRPEAEDHARVPEPESHPPAGMVGRHKATKVGQAKKHVAKATPKSKKRKIAKSHKKSKSKLSGRHKKPSRKTASAKASRGSKKLAKHKESKSGSGATL